MNYKTETPSSALPETPASGTAVVVPSSDWLGSVVRVSDAPGGARIYGTARDALHAVLRVDGDLAAVALIGDNNLSWVNVRALVRATPKELYDYQQTSWDRSAFVRKVPPLPNTEARQRGQ